uniref:Ty3 transposon capsid-like protein domain-containing protein n=1 Tax=Tanacetum cinerariifolium TaxID=118510 RepID=A0A699HFG6_TANCI|nr:hypothetical protein [Tanacetum cinerariifolium]
MERAITTDASLEAAQDSDNIIKTQTTTMPNVEIPQEIDTGGSPRRQETIGGTSAQTRSERVLEQRNEPPLTKGHTSGSGEDRLEENIKLTDTVPTHHDLPLTGGYTPGSDEGRITLAELMKTYTTLSNMVTQLENELSTTKSIYNKAFITLTNRVKKLESQLKQKRSSVVIHSPDEEGPRVHIEDSPKQGRIIEEIDKDKNINLVSEQGEVQETVKHSIDDDETLAETLLNLSLDEELAQKLYTKELAKEGARQEQERYNLEKALELQRQQDQRKENVPKGSSNKQRLDQQTEEPEEEAETQGDSDQEVEELKLYMRIIHEEDIAIEAIPLAIKPYAYGRLTKIEFPKFEIDDVLSWLYKVNKFYEMDHIDDDAQKIRLVSTHMFGKVLNWHKHFMAKQGAFMTWGLYQTYVKKQFELVFKDPIVELKNLKQTTVQVYQESFKDLLNKVELSDEYAISLFIGGLKEDIVYAVRMFKLNTLSDVFCLSKLQEASNSVTRGKQLTTGYKNNLVTNYNRGGGNEIRNATTMSV